MSLRKNNEHIKLVYTDTDSYVIQTMTDDVYKDFSEIKQHMDFSDYPPEHPCFDKTNKKVLGMFKDEEWKNHYSIHRIKT